MNKLINSVDGVAIDAPAVAAGGAAAHLARTVEDVERPEIAGSWDAPMSTLALRWER
jgi:hypothetical protein